MDTVYVVHVHYTRPAGKRDWYYVYKKLATARAMRTRRGRTWDGKPAAGVEVTITELRLADGTVVE